MIQKQAKSADCIALMSPTHLTYMRDACSIFINMYTWRR